MTTVVPSSVAITSTLLVITACQGNATTPGNLVGTYAVHGVLVENTCGQSGLMTVNPLDFSVELREEQGVGYWVASNAAQSSGLLNADGSFSFTVSQSQIVSRSAPGADLSPADYASQNPDTNFDLRQTTCAVTMNETISGNLTRWRSLGGKSNALTTPSADDLSARDVITLDPTAGSNCNAALTVFGGAYSALPCRASYVLSGDLDASPVTAPPVVSADADAGAL